MSPLRRIAIALPLLLLVAASAFGAATISTATRPTYDVRLMTIGQSLIDQITYTNGAKGLINQLKTGAVSPTVGSAELIRRAVGGSFACLENDPLADTGNYWVQYNSGSPIAGPWLTVSITDITERLALGTAPTAFIFDQGQQDAEAVAGNVEGVDSGLAATRFDACWKFAFAALQTAMAGSGPIPIYVSVLGRSCQNTNAAGWDTLRKLELAWLAGGVANTYRTPDNYDLANYACVHPDRSYVQEYGRRFGAKIANVQYSGVELIGPTISGMTQPTSTTVQVTIATESGDTITRPIGEPWGFDFYDGTVLLTKTWVGWFSGNPRWSFASAPSFLKMAYVSGAGAAPLLDNPNRIIRGTTSGIPLAQRYLP